TVGPRTCDRFRTRRSLPSFPVSHHPRPYLGSARLTPPPRAGPDPKSRRHLAVSVGNEGSEFGRAVVTASESATASVRSRGPMPYIRGPGSPASGEPTPATTATSEVRNGKQHRGHRCARRGTVPGDGGRNRRGWGPLPPPGQGRRLHPHGGRRRLLGTGCGLEAG